MPVSPGRGLDGNGRPHQLIVEKLSVEEVEDFIEVATDTIIRCKLLHGDFSFQILMIEEVGIYEKRAALDG